MDILYLTKSQLKLAVDVYRRSRFVQLALPPRYTKAIQFQIRAKDKLTRTLPLFRRDDAALTAK